MKIKKVMNWGLTVRLIVILFTFLTIAGGCAESLEDQIRERLDLFRAVLPDDARAAFDNKEYDRAVVLIEKQLDQDKEFKQRWDKMKEDEAIDLFTVEETVDYFHRYFVQPLEKM